ncbi:TPA: hypothetical protein QDA74_001709 [Burkholderia territorii]|uniref:hypothetical protein n=1 Tax=Burkholderia territorii TaxID=1503055 RepID=UPI0011C89C8D|nr:hypothetical protein [Burkholderia territorii]TXG03550.1 hypothetical protein FU139_30120 [Burkholderia territorii]HDR8857571.1 hypothetical protein [Burkholderia territorii]HDR8863808.1 hypothetical protein [Burkholderia territorii]HDR8869780.1 hypothetical protein [Burkholderia territorii]HDR8876250.1 hypothetical protein [Burkholderia territorii]
MKRATAILRKGKILIDGYSQTTSGVWIGVGPVFVVDENDVEKLTVSLKEALANSKVGVPHPAQNEWKDIQKPMLEAAGVKSWRTLAKGAKAVGIYCEDSRVRMEPSSNYENGGGTGLPEQTVECDLDSPDLGAALMNAFRACN